MDFFLGMPLYFFKPSFVITEMNDMELRDITRIKAFVLQMADPSLILAPNQIP